LAFCSLRSNANNLKIQITTNSHKDYRKKDVLLL
jgi:hypothetical protein